MPVTHCASTTSHSRAPSTAANSMSLRNYYYILGIQPNATEEELRQAYKAMALKWHPDRHLDDAENATRRFLEVQEAYRALMRERHQYLDSSFASRMAQRSDSRQTGPSFSESTSSLASFIHVSTSSTDSLGTAPSTVKSGISHAACYSPCCQPVSPTFVSHPQTYANDDLDHSHRPHKKSQPYGSYHNRHSSGDIRYPNEWTNYTPPTLHKYKMTQQRREPQPFTIIPPLRKPRLQTTTPTSWDYYGIHDRKQAIPLRSIGIGPSKEWIYTLSLTLEELLKGKQCCFSFSRKLRSGVTKSVMLSVDIPPGCREGTRILCRGVGDEHKDGTRQDIAFIVEELQHEHFSRFCDDLVLDVRIPCDSLRHQGGGFFVEGIDKQKYWFNVDYPRERVLKGKHVIKGAGMPIRHAGQIVGRGCLIIQWEIIMVEQPKVFGFMKRFMHFRK